MKHTISLLVCVMLLLAGCQFQNNTLRPDPTVEKYFEYFGRSPIDLLFYHEGTATSFSDLEMASYALSMVASEQSPSFDYEVGAARQDVDAMVTKYFSSQVGNYETNFTTVLPSGNITFTGWDITGNYFVLKELTAAENGVTKAVFYTVPKTMWNIDYEKHRKDALTGNFDNSVEYGLDGESFTNAFERLGLVELEFIEKTGEDGELYLEYRSANGLGEAGQPYEIYKTP